MEGAWSRTEAFWPSLLRAGASFAVAALAAAYVYVRVAARKTNNYNPTSKAESSSSSSSSSVLASNEPKAAYQAEEEEDDRSVESTACEEHEETNGDKAQNEVAFGLDDWINELQARFERYQSMKEYEGRLIELQNTLHLEVARGDSLEKKVSLLEAEARRVRDLETYCLNLQQQAKNLEQENEILKKKVKRLSRRSREGDRVVAEQKLRIQESEAMIIKSHEEVAKGAEQVNRKAEEIAELQSVVDRLRRETTELSDKLELAEASLTLKHEAEITTINEYKHIINELEKLQKEFTAEVNEQVYLRWTNACLRHQLMQAHAQEELRLDVTERKGDAGIVHAKNGGEQHALLKLHLHHELGRMAMERDNSISPEVKIEGDSKSIALVKKLKRWVDGNHNGKTRVKAGKSASKCLGRHFSSDWVEEHVHGRMSFSSA